MFDDVDPRNRDDDARDRESDWIDIGRGSSTTSLRDEHLEDDSRRGSDARHERDRDSRDRDDDRVGSDPRDAFTRDLDLPRGREREMVSDRDRDYTLNGDESRALAVTGAFRVVSERDLRGHEDRPSLRDSNLRHLKSQGLIERVALDGHDRAVVLTDRGRELLEHHQRGRDDRQAFHSGADKPRERSHDAQVYRAYLKAAERLRERDARIVRVELDRELKRDYQRFLQERNRDRSDSDGRPDRDAQEIEEWAREHDLPYFDDSVHFPDLRIEYEVDGRLDHEDIEVVTANYRGAHAASRGRSGFTCYGSRGGRSGGSRGVGLADEFV